MNRSILIASILACCLLLYGSLAAITVKWDQVYGGLNLDEAYGIVQTPDSGYVLTGFTSSEGAGGNDLFLMRIDRYGGEVWTKTFGGTASDWGFDVLVTPDSDIVAVGYSSSFSPSPQVYVVKTNLDGGIIWSRIFGGPAADYGYSVTLAPDSDYVIAGETYSFGGGLSDVYILKVSKEGVLLWSKFYGGIGYDWGQSICSLKEGGYAVAGFTSSFGAGNYDVYALRLEPDGDTVWGRTFGSPTFDGARAVVESAQNTLVMAGVTNRNPIKNNDAYLLGATLDGQLIWETLVGGSGSEAINRLLDLPSGDIFAVGESSSSSAGAEDLFLLQFDDEGDSLESITHGSSDADVARTAVDYLDLGVLVAGYSRSFGSQSQVYVARADEEYICGDADGDGGISLSDAVFLIQYIFAGGRTPYPVLSGDADCSGGISLNDAVYIIQYIFAGGPGPCPDCVPDP